MICGENGALKALDDAKAAIQSKIGEGMAALDDLEAQANAALKSLEEFKPELPDLPDLQGELQKALSEATPAGLAAKLKEIEQKFESAFDEVEGGFQGMLKDIGADLKSLLKNFPPSIDSIMAAVCEKVPNKQITQGGVIVDKPQEPYEATSFPAEMPVFPTPVGPVKQAVIPTVSGYKDYSEAPTPTVATGRSTKTLRELMLFRESSNNYDGFYGTDRANKLGYVGGYQFGALALEDLGYIKTGFGSKGNSILENSSAWTGKNGMTNLQAFLRNPAEQDQAFDNYTVLNKSTLTVIGVINSNTPADQVNGYLAAAHLVGAGGVKKGLDSQDANGVKAREYYNLGLTAKLPEDSTAEIEANASYELLQQVMDQATELYPWTESVVWWKNGIYSAMYFDLPESKLGGKEPINSLWPSERKAFVIDDVPEDKMMDANRYDFTIGQSWGYFVVERYEELRQERQLSKGVEIGSLALAITLKNSGFSS